MRKKPLSGGAKLKRAGLHPILIGVTPDDLSTIKQAASIEMRPVSQFVRFHAVTAAIKTITIEHSLGKPRKEASHG